MDFPIEYIPAANNELLPEIILMKPPNLDFALFLILHNQSKNIFAVIDEHFFKRSDKHYFLLIVLC